MTNTMPTSKQELLYLIGQPGAGKTSLFAELLAGLPYKVESQPFAHMVYAAAGLVQLGAARAPFGGTDALPMNVQPKVVEWLTSTPHHFVIAEGDRLANAKFFQTVRDLGWHLTVAYLDAPQNLLDQRRAQRGSHQHPTWLKGRRTKVENLAASWASLDYWLDGTLPLAELTQCLSSHPCLACTAPGKELTHAPS